MGVICAAERGSSGGEKDLFISHEEYLETRERWVVLDCSKADVTVNGSKVKPQENYKLQRITGALFLDLTTFGLKAPSTIEMANLLQGMGIGKECNVLCYDSFDGIFAVRAACLLYNLGISNTKVLNGKFAELKNPEGNHYYERKDAHPDPVKPCGKDFAFCLLNPVFASEDDVAEVCFGKGVAQLVQICQQTDYEKQKFPKSTFLSDTVCLTSNHAVHKKEDILKALREKGISALKPIILVGGSPKAFVVKHCLAHCGIKDVKICEIKWAESSIKKRHEEQVKSQQQA